MELNRDMEQVQLLTTKCVVNKLVKPPLEIVDECTQTIIPDPLEVKLNICNEEISNLTKEVEKYKDETMRLSSVLSKIQIKEMWSRKVITQLNKSCAGNKATKLFRIWRETSRKRSTHFK